MSSYCFELYVKHLFLALLIEVNQINVNAPSKSFIEQYNFINKCLNVTLMNQ